jgi:adenylate kinase family enzyme
VPFRAWETATVERVAIVGSGGAGKSTLAVEIGQRTGLPVFHLDRFFWKPGWIPTPDAEWRAVQAELVARERWIIDGNYGATLDIRFARADTVVALALSRVRCVTRAASRSLRNRGQAVQADGCPERMDRAFLRWVWRYPVDSRPRLDAALDRHRAHARVVELTSPAAVARFLDQLPR